MKVIVITLGVGLVLGVAWSPFSSEPEVRVVTKVKEVEKEVEVVEYVSLPLPEDCLALAEDSELFVEHLSELSADATDVKTSVESAAQYDFVSGRIDIREANTIRSDITTSTRKFAGSYYEFDTTLQTFRSQVERCKEEYGNQ